MAIANLAMATGNIGRDGVGVNPLRGQNNVQGSCDMGSFPHEFSGYRHVSDDATRDIFEKLWGLTLSKEPGLRIPNMMDEAVDGDFKGLYIQGEDIAQSDPDTKHITAGLKAMECVIVQDLFLNETARYAHIFFPGASFLEKDGTFTNAERRINRVRKAIEPLAGKARLGGHAGLRQRARRADGLQTSERDHGRGRRYDADLQRRQLRQARRTRLGAMAVQRRRADGHADHARRPLRARQGPVHADRICRDRRAQRAALPAAADDRAHPVAIQRRRADPAHREQPLARGGRAGDPSVRRREPRRARRRSRARCRAASAKSACAPESRSGCSRASSTRRSITPTAAPMW